jgi:hypothetical protein
LNTSSITILDQLEQQLLRKVKRDREAERRRKKEDQEEGCDNATLSCLF